MKITLEFKLDRSDAVPAPLVRAWVDVDRTGILTHDEEVRFGQDNLTWRGEIGSGESSTLGMLFTLKYIAPPNAKWSLVMSSDTPNTHEVFRSSGTVKATGGRLVGAMRA